MTGGQIRDAAATARQIAAFQGHNDGRPTLDDLQEACRMHSNRKLETLARRIVPRYRWKDIVLPNDRMEQLQEICATLQYRPVVFGEWGFDAKLSLGKGLNVLFAGPSGTGKTMAAEILACELGLELYKTDLSTIVSKYIGETEKNLSRIFAEAASSNAILFFDEADALFGKRSEVRDSHDRYANIEVNYLLQEMERYEGMAILATNLRKNIDEAFVRRMHFVVEFPFPSAGDRLRIWQSVLPEDAPRASDLDLEFLAESFELSGGNLKNIALGGAFLAASDGGRITMAHLIRATRRECQKIGKVLTGDEFGEYSVLAGFGTFGS
jgi:SpoVK/Ycf46/Vps4 family AAA+-type ATPase